MPINMSKMQSTITTHLDQHRHRGCARHPPQRSLGKEDRASADTVERGMFSMSVSMKYVSNEINQQLAERDIPTIFIHS